MTDEKAAANAGTGQVEGVIITSEEGGVASVVAAAADDQGNAIVEGVIADDQGILAEGAIGISGDDAVLVARFASMDAAKQAYSTLVEAEAAGRLDIEGVLVANADAAGKINIVKMTDHHTRHGFAVGAVAGIVAGIIFPPSILASAVVLGAGGAGVGKLQNINQRNAVARDLASVLTPGSSGIVALVKLTEVEQVKQQIPQAEEVKAAPVSDETAAAVKEAAKASGSAASEAPAS